MPNPTGFAVLTESGLHMHVGGGDAAQVDDVLTERPLAVARKSRRRTRLAAIERQVCENMRAGGGPRAVGES